MSDREQLRAWAQSLGTMNHYQILGIERTATPDEVKRGFSVFAESFHPDGHRGRMADEQELVMRIFMRGTEAYRALSNSERRFQYDTKTFGPAVGPESTQMGIPASSGPQVHIADRVRVAAAKPFVMKALQLLESGAFARAKLDLTMAMNMDRDNTHLQQLMARIDDGMKKKP